MGKGIDALAHSEASGLGNRERTWGAGPAVARRLWSRGQGGRGFWAGTGHLLRGPSLGTPRCRKHLASDLICSQDQPVSVGRDPGDGYHCPLGPQGPTSQSWSVRIRLGGPGCRCLCLTACWGEQNLPLWPMGAANPSPSLGTPLPVLCLYSTPPQGSALHYLLVPLRVPFCLGPAPRLLGKHAWNKWMTVTPSLNGVQNMLFPKEHFR